jgi:hypothetical protein
MRTDFLPVPVSPQVVGLLVLDGAILVRLYEIHS